MSCDIVPDDGLVYILAPPPRSTIWYQDGIGDQQQSASWGSTRHRHPWGQEDTRRRVGVRHTESERGSDSVGVERQTTALTDETECTGRQEVSLGYSWLGGCGSAVRCDSRGPGIAQGHGPGPGAPRGPLETTRTPGDHASTVFSQPQPHGTPSAPQSDARARVCRVRAPSAQRATALRVVDGDPYSGVTSRTQCHERPSPPAAAPVGHGASAEPQCGNHRRRP